ncbi:UPF0182 family protein [Paenibacillus sp. IB182496]|uniref:UPF0182 protein IDH44_01130 n=2 Tax=Paenibacillus sabuli TaxID=2772509 RepID=A0A927GPS5_9BACL|nr:UPF0182 family protein [Paenibacillus sabuli]
MNNMRMPRLSKRASGLLKLAAVLLVLLLAAVATAGWWADYVWASSLGFKGTFLTIFASRIGLGALGFVLFFATTFWLLRNIRATFVKQRGLNNLHAFLKNGKLYAWSNAAVSLLLGWIGYSWVQGLGWQRLLGYLYQTDFGTADPHFGLDVSFFVYTLPMWKFALGVLLFLAVLNVAAKLIIYGSGGMIGESRGARVHFIGGVVWLGLLVTAHFALSPYETALTAQVNAFQQSVVHGVSFTDKYVNIPADYAMAAVSLIVTAMLVLALIRKRAGLLKGAAALYIGVLVLGQAASLGVQGMLVSPNEFAREEPFIADSVAMTRQAHELDGIEVIDKQVNASLDQGMLDRNETTMRNIRINDARPLGEVYNQLQTIRPYYNFADVDIDRYMIDGEYQQVFIAARELTQANLPEQAQTWVNQNLRYTHGYGVAVSAVNEITAEGQPEYLVENLPPEGSIPISRPQIYFGENRYDSVIVNSKVTEFDYPDAIEDEPYVYEGEAGIRMNGINRLLFAWNEGAYRYLISGQITGDSQLLQTRNIYDRVHRIAPFLDLEPDAYPVIREDGTLVWLIDAFTSTDRYPFSDDDGYGDNYIRNSIKIAVEAYTGEVTFYLVDPDDPLAQTYNKMFPGLLTTEVPEDIRSHFRYPETLFKQRASLYRAYHMTDLQLFYNREDYWQFPTEKYFGDDIEMDPYYVTLKLNEADQEELVLMTPFTPNRKQNLIAWMGVRNDGDRYGEMLVYEYSRQRNIYGPQQIENRVNQNAEISQQLNLWSQGGSNVIRGNLLVIPIEDTLLYIEPLYIESSNETSLPEVKRIIVAYEDYIVMEPTLEQSLQRLFERMGEPYGDADEPEDDGQTQTPDTGTPVGGTGDGTPGTDTGAAADVLQQAESAFEAYRAANREGDYEAAGRALQELERLLQGAAGTSEGASAGSTGDGIDAGGSDVGGTGDGIDGGSSDGSGTGDGSDGGSSDGSGTGADASMTDGVGAGGDMTGGAGAEDAVTDGAVAP